MSLSDTSAALQLKSIFQRKEVNQMDPVETAKKRMLEWANPVEFVNNMYACHPGQAGDEYFETVFAKLEEEEY